MKKEVFIIRNTDGIEPCVAWIKEHLTLVGAVEVAVSTETHSRSVQQLRLYFLWVTEIGNHIGLLKDETHEMLKRRFAVPIFTRDDPDYAAMVAAVKGIRKQGMTDYAEALAKEISRLTSTTDFTVEEMSEYLKSIEFYAAEVGARLSFPEDLYSEELKRR